MHKKAIAAGLVSSVLAGTTIASANAACYGVATVTGGSVNVRSGPSTSSGVIATANAGDVVVIEGNSNNFHKVVLNGKEGYIADDYLSYSNSADGNFGTAYITGSDVNVRSTADTSGAVVTTAQAGTPVEVIGVNGRWYKVRINGQTGYVSGPYVSYSSSGSSAASSGNGSAVSGSAVSGSNSSEVRYIKGSSVRLRSGPSTSSGILSICNNGAQVKLNSVSNGWAYVTTSDGKTGYVAAAYLSYSPQSVSSAPAQSQQSWTGYIKGNNVRVRSGPSTSYSILTTLSNGTPVTVTSQDGSWDGVTVNGQSGYVSSVYISSTKPVVSASPAASSKGQQIANTAVQYVGYPYVYGGTDPSGFDCSGFVKYIFGLYGITTNRTAEDQARNGYAVDRSQLQPGDIICFSYGSGYIGHVGIYIGNGQFVHACNSDTGVIITDLNSSSYTNRVAACRRLV